MSRARCVPLQYHLNATPGVKARVLNDSNQHHLTSGVTRDDFVVRPHLPRRDLQESTHIQPSTGNLCEMFTPATNMDCERYQDLSELGLFGPEAPTWAVGEVSGETPNKLSEMQDGMHPSKTHFITLDYENTDYSLGDMSNQFYNISRTDSMEEMKNFPLTAPMEVVPMRHHETLQVSGIVKTEKEELDVGREEEVEEEYEEVRNSVPVRPTELKMDPDILKEDPDLLLLDTPDLLSELQNEDLIDYILRDTPPRSLSPSGPLSTPPRIHLGTPPRSIASPIHPLVTPPARLLATPPRALAAPSRSIETPSRFSSSAETLKSNSYKPKPVRETYLAIPREITAGIGDDKKIPKMLILKTPESTTLSSQLQDMAMSIAERIKTVGKRQRNKRYSDVSGDEDASEEESQKQSPRKRARRTSTCSTSTSSGQDKYRELRDKNNEASRKSRQNRKEKERDLMNTLEDAEQENTQLRARSDELEKLVHSLRKLLLQIVVSKGTQR